MIVISYDCAGAVEIPFSTLAGNCQDLNFGSDNGDQILSCCFISVAVWRLVRSASLLSSP